MPTLEQRVTTLEHKLLALRADVDTLKKNVQQQGATLMASIEQLRRDQQRFLEQYKRASRDQYDPSDHFHTAAAGGGRKWLSWMSSGLGSGQLAASGKVSYRPG